MDAASQRGILWDVENPGPGVRYLKRDLRKDAMSLVSAAINGSDPEKLTLSALSADVLRLRTGGQEYDLASFRNIYLVGTGKAAASMARGAESALGDKITAGAVSVKDDYGLALLYISRCRPIKKG